MLAPSPEKNIQAFLDCVFRALSTLWYANYFNILLVAVELYLVDPFGDLGHFIGHLLKAIFYTIETLFCTAICAMKLSITVAKPLYVLRTWGEDSAAPCCFGGPSGFIPPSSLELL